MDSQPAPDSRTIPVSEWLITLLILSIPLVNIIALIVWAAGSTTAPSKKNWATASLIWIGICIVVGIGFAILATVLGVAAGGAAQAY